MRKLRLDLWSTSRNTSKQTESETRVRNVGSVPSHSTVISGESLHWAYFCSSPREIRVYNTWSRAIPGVVGGIMPSPHHWHPRLNGPHPETCDYVTFQGKEDLGDGIKVANNNGRESDAVTILPNMVEGSKREVWLWKERMQRCSVADFEDGRATSQGIQMTSGSWSKQKSPHKIQIRNKVLITDWSSLGESCAGFLS